MKQRLLNCDFVNESSFKVKLGNKAKLLYFYMFACADDKGFVGITKELITTLDGLEKNENLELFNDNYSIALQELLDRGLLYEFNDNHGNVVHLIRHWYFHNHLFKKAWTNYGKYLKQVKLVNNEYVLIKNDEVVEEVDYKEEDLTEENKEWDRMVKELDDLSI